jgi:hypothetical protein
MPRHALRAELAAKLSGTWAGAAGRHVLDGDMPAPAGNTGRHALTAEVDAIVTGPPAVTYRGTASNRAFSATNVVGAIAGGTVIGDTGGVTAGRLWVLATTATAANQTGGTWTWPASHNHIVTIVAYGRAAAPATAGMVRAAASATTVVAPSVTSARASAMLVVFAFFATNGTAPAWPTSMTVRSPAAAASAAGVAADEALPTPGASGTRTFTPGGTPSALTAASVLLEAV